MPTVRQTVRDFAKPASFSPAEQQALERLGYWLDRLDRTDSDIHAQTYAGHVNECISLAIAEGVSPRELDCYVLSRYHLAELHAHRNIAATYGKFGKVG